MLAAKTRSFHPPLLHHHPSGTGACAATGPQEDQPIGEGCDSFARAAPCDGQMVPKTQPKYQQGEWEFFLPRLFFGPLLFLSPPGPSDTVTSSTATIAFGAGEAESMLPVSSPSSSVPLTPNTQQYWFLVLRLQLRSNGAASSPRSIDRDARDLCRDNH